MLILLSEWQLSSPDTNSGFDLDIHTAVFKPFLCTFDFMCGACLVGKYTSIVVCFHQDFSVFCCIDLTFCRHKPSRACCREASTQHDAATTRLHDGDGVFWCWVIPNTEFSMMAKNSFTFTLQYFLFFVNKKNKKKHPNYIHCDSVL